MSELRKRLGIQAKTLIALASDIHQAIPEACVRHLLPNVAADTWDGVCEAPRTLGPNAPVDRWVLASHFLTQWLEWKMVTERWCRYFGVLPDSVPAVWKRADRRCQPLAEGLLCDRDLLRIIGEQIVVAAAVARIGGSEPDGYGLCEHIADLESLKSLADASQGEGELTTDESSFRSRLSDREQRLRELHNRLSPEEQDVVVECMRCYRRSTLAYSWLVPQEKYHALTWWETHMSKDQMSFQKAPPPEPLPDDRLDGLLREILDRIEKTVAEIGYEAFTDDVTSDDFIGGPDAIVNTQQANLIPGDSEGRCCPVLMAVSRGTGKRSVLGFSRVMELMKARLFQCKGVTRRVIFLCDQWDSAVVQQDHLPYLRACYQAGVRFTFLLVGPDGRSISPVNVDLR